MQTYFSLLILLYSTFVTSFLLVCRKFSHSISNKTFFLNGAVGITEDDTKVKSVEKPRPPPPTFSVLLQALDWLMLLSGLSPRRRTEGSFLICRGIYKWRPAFKCWEAIAGQEKRWEIHEECIWWIFLSLFWSPASSECSCCYNSTVFAFHVT